jgi:hypothetical protein
MTTRSTYAEHLGTITVFGGRDCHRNWDSAALGLVDAMKELLTELKLLCDELVQFLPHWMIRRYPLNKWYHVAADWDEMLLQHRAGVDWIVDKHTGIMYKGSKRIQ